MNRKKPHPATGRKNDSIREIKTDGFAATARKTVEAVSGNGKGR
jgi:hypothetical protein